MYIDVEQLINLSAVPGIGHARIRSLVAKFKSIDAIWDASVKELTSVDSIDVKIARQIKNFSEFDIGKKQMELAKKVGARIVTFWDEEYPANLKQIYDPPSFFFIAGSLENSDKYAIAVVGTRTPSEYGKIVTEKLIQDLSRQNITIVSGMARGIDTIAHQVAIRSDGRTIAVLGSGLDKIYPPENAKLFSAIKEHGAVVSEYLMGTMPDAPNFPRRNRIISGLSIGVIVVEAGIKSGALLTANLALDQNREVFAVPGNITSPKSAGTNQLIKVGAKLTSSARDIFLELEPMLKPFLKSQEKKEEIPQNLTQAERKIIAALSHEPIHIDKLAAKLEKGTAEVLADLLGLEFKGLVKQLPGKFFVKI